MSIHRSIAFLIVQYPPKLEAWIGYGESNVVSARHVLRFVESRMFISVEHRPYGIPAAKSISFRLSRFFNRTFNHRSWVAGATNQNQSCGRLISIETIEYIEIAGLCHGSFGNDHDPQGWAADRSFTADAPRGAVPVAHFPAAGRRSASKARRKSSAVGTPPKRP